MEPYSLPLVALSMIAIILWGILGQRAAERKAAEAEAQAEAEADKAAPRTTPKAGPQAGLGVRRR